VPATRPVRLWHLLTHTAGLTYGFHYAHPVDAAYRAAGFEWVAPEGRDLAACCEAWAGLPLLFEPPGSEWNYSMASDVLGRVIEVVSGQPLDRFLDERVLGAAPHARHRLLGRGLGRGQAGRALQPGAPTGGRSATTSWAGSPCAARTAWPAGAGWSPPPPTTTASPRCCSAAASWAGCACSAPAPCAT
jgi:CubicO group peptidase (beta-lactamase class C family)